jgi:hypothetical protein
LSFENKYKPISREIAVFLTIQTHTEKQPTSRILSIALSLCKSAKNKYLFRENIRKRNGCLACLLLRKLIERKKKNAGALLQRG